MVQNHFADDVVFVVIKVFHELAAYFAHNNLSPGGYRIIIQPLTPQAEVALKRTFDKEIRSFSLSTENPTSYIDEGRLYDIQFKIGRA